MIPCKNNTPSTSSDAWCVCSLFPRGWRLSPHRWLGRSTVACGAEVPPGRNPLQAGRGETVGVSVSLGFVSAMTQATFGEASLLSYCVF